MNKILPIILVVVLSGCATWGETDYRTPSKSWWSSIWPTYEWKNKFTGKKDINGYIESQCNELSQLNWVNTANPENVMRGITPHVSLSHYAEAHFFLAPWIISDYKNKCMERKGYYKYKNQ